MNDLMSTLEATNYPSLKIYYNNYKKPFLTCLTDMEIFDVWALWG